jgi:hypothetical protein
MASVIDVCNRALDKLGQSPITSLEDGNKAANLCNRTWPVVRNRLLRSYPWNFAVKRDSTAPESDTPSWGATYQHSLPADCLRLIEILDVRTTEYEVEGNKILCDDEVLYIRYIREVTDPNEFDALFLDAAASLMAFEMCEALTQSNTKKDVLWNEYNENFAIARRIDAQVNPISQFEEDSWIEARY